MTQFKDKSQKQDKNINAGLLYYPILMVADILLYHGDLIPVGQDQIQHVELTRDTVRWFNKRYGDYFKEPKVLLTEVPKVMSLLHPEKKMSKSDGPNAVVELGDEPDVIEKKLKKAVTATEGGGKAPGVENLLLLLKQFGSKELHTQFVKEEKAGTIRYGDLKGAVAEAIARAFTDFRSHRAKLLANPNEIKRLLDSGAKKAYTVASQTMEDVRLRVGIR
jgi:tryptophanyl-tRNA synthetase